MALIAGIPKAATTWLYRGLSSHPGVCAGRIKEPHFFAEDLPQLRRVTNRDEYDSLFERTAAQHLDLDASVFSVFSDHAVAVQRSAFPSLRVVVLVRNPVSFLGAIHHELWMAGLEAEPDLATAWFRDLRSEAAHPLSYPRMCRYADRIDALERALGGNPLLVMPMDDVVTNPAATMVRAERFLGLDPVIRELPGAANPAMVHRFPRLGRFVAQPPWPLAGLKRRMVARGARENEVGATGVVPALRRLNQRLNRTSVTRPDPPPAVRESVLDHTADDRLRLADRLGRSDLPWLVDS